MLSHQLIHAVRHAILLAPFGPAVLQLWRRRHADPLRDRGRREGWDATARWLLSPEGVTQSPATRAHPVLRETINTDIDTELLWTAVRKLLLLSGSTPDERPELWELVVSLVRQCINNEYVWYVSDIERAELGRRRAALAAGGGLKRPGEVAVLATYLRLEELLPARELVSWPECPSTSWLQLVEAHLANWREEQEYRASMPAFGAISRPASAVVAATYEAHPYPRWLDWDMDEARRRQQHDLTTFFNRAETAYLERPFRMLVAGCGTGAKAIAYALAAPHGSILAIDLSRASLAYAKRMARGYGVRNIDFLQMDLLDLPSLGRTFDFVESTGVLHHLANPTEGGRALATVLRKGGIAHISLYSELSRREIVRLRGAHAGRLGRATDDDVRSLRWRLLHEDPELIDERLPLRWDFFDMNRCRDLLFHPQEHRFTLPQVAELLADMGLEFRGLGDPEVDTKAFWTQLPRDRRSIAAWHAFELAHPDSFANLYEVWAFKP